MKHVIIDRPRRGGDGGKSILPKGSKKRLQKTPWEEQKKFESNAPHRVYGWDGKELNEHLSPLRRWLRSQCGRDWDEVWSEICEGLSVRNATTAHVRDHADDYVKKNCYIDENGVIRDSRGFSVGGYGNYASFYVDPYDNILKEAKSQPRYRSSRYTKKKEWIVSNDPDIRYYLLKNIWYEVFLKPFPVIQGFPQHCVWDAVIAATWKGSKKYYGSPLGDCKRRHGKEVYAFKKRQLSKREIHKLDLWNKIS